MLFIAVMAILLRVNYLAVIQMPAITSILCIKRTIGFLIELLFGEKEEKKKKEKDGRK